MDTHITPHFSLAEFQRSATASRLGIDNTIPQQFIPSIKNLCEQVLEPLREHIDQPIIISSGYRCPSLNKEVGGVSNSQHMTGEAADIVPSTIDGRKYVADLREWFRWLEDYADFDQLLFEKSGTKTWIHVSCKPDLTMNRHMVRKIRGS